MADFKVDSVRYRTGKKLTIWLFNDESHYKNIKLMARYDFGRTGNDDVPQKLLSGIYRIPYEDGWQYLITTSTHPALVDTIIEYAEFGWFVNDDGEKEAFTYLRHNRKALGIHYLIERYVANYKWRKQWFNDNLLLCPDKNRQPYFPSPEKYNGNNLAPHKVFNKKTHRY